MRGSTIAIDERGAASAPEAVGGGGQGAPSGLGGRRPGGAMSDAHPKRSRSFLCRDLLWEQVERMAGDLECSVDYLLNEALKAYLRRQSRLSTPLEVEAARASPAAPPAAGRMPSTAALPPPSFAAPVGPPAVPAPARPGPPALPIAARPGPPAPLDALLTRSLPPPSRRTAPPPWLPPALPPAPLPPPQRPAVPPPQPRPFAPAPASAVLSAVYEGVRHPVTKDRFVIGRGRREVDLVIRDPNVSRLHAMVELCGGQYFLVDLGSTNGVEHLGQRIARKPIAEGDVIRICDHEVHFTFRG